MDTSQQKGLKTDGARFHPGYLRWEVFFPSAGEKAPSYHKALPDALAEHKRRAALAASKKARRLSR